MIGVLADVWDEAVNGPWIKKVETDTEYKVSAVDGAVHIAICGSSTLFDANGRIKIDWRQNFNFRRSVWTIGGKIVYVHEGFLTKWLSIMHEIEDYVMDSGKLQVKVSGFSQGAAVAFLCAAHLQDLGYDVDYIGFGQPRVIYGRQEFKPGTFENFLRVRVKKDLVSVAPPRWLGYQDYGMEKPLLPSYKWYEVYKNHMSYGRLLGAKTDFLQGVA